MADVDFDRGPAGASELVAAVIRAVAADERLLGVAVGGSGATATLDEFSDVDLVIGCRDERHADVLAAAPAFAGALGPLVAGFTGEHVGEPRLYIALYGPPALHVDLKFVAERDLADRVEDGVVLWQRDGAFNAARRRAPAVWPQPDRQWIEDRFWTWTHYGAAKIGRGELLECLEMLTFTRRLVLGPLIAATRDPRPSGVRRLERLAPELLPDLHATVGAPTPAACAAALRATIALYLRLRDAGPPVERRAGAEALSVAYLDAVAPS